MPAVKQIAYFLCFCDMPASLCFLHKYGFLFKENKNLPARFMKNSRRFFKKSTNLSADLKEDSFLPWKNFCKKSSFEEVFPVILCGILNCAPEKASWLLKVPPETLSYRLEQGFSALNKELEGFNFSGFKVALEKTSSSGVKAEKALMYCRWLGNRALPSELEKAKPKKLKIRYGLLYKGLFLILFLLLIFYTGRLLFSPSGKIILYSLTSSQLAD